jgi:hypothetical protein
MNIRKVTFWSKADEVHWLPKNIEISFRIAVNLAFLFSGAHIEILK